MDTPNSPAPEEQPAPTTPTEGPTSVEQDLDYEADSNSRLQDFISNIPWGKIIFGVVILFCVVWALVYLFSSKKTTVVTEIPVQIEEAKKNIALTHATVAQGLLGSAQYNTILQPRFSLDPANISADEPKVALLQSLGVLEQSLQFDVWAYLAGQTNREVALQSYNDKLAHALNTSTQWLAQAREKQKEVIANRNTAITLQTQLLSQVNTILLRDPASAEFVDRYRSFVEANNQLVLLDNELALLNQVINQAPALLTRADTRTKNIAFNRTAIIQNIKIVDLDDPGLKLVTEPTVVK